MKITKYQRERIQNYIDTRNLESQDNPMLEVIIVKQYTSTLFSFMFRGGGMVLYEISKMGEWNESDYNIVYHITHKTEVA